MCLCADVECVSDFEIAFITNHMSNTRIHTFLNVTLQVILTIIACHHSFIFELFEYTKPGGNAVPVVLKQALSRERMRFFTKKEKDIVTALTKIVESAGDIQGAVRLFQEVDEVRAVSYIYLISCIDTT